MSSLRTRRILLVALLASGSTLLASSDVPADEPKRSSFDPSTFGPLGVLRDATIRRWLTLSPQQQAAVAEVEQDWADHLRQYNMSRAQTRTAQEYSLHKTLRRCEDRSLATLTGQQEARFRHASLARFVIPEPLALLRTRTDELNLTIEQRENVEQLYDEWLTRVETVLTRVEENSNWREARLRGMQLLQHQSGQWALRAVTAILDADQQKRLAQLQLQQACLMDGPGVLLRADVRRPLRLSDAQQRDIHAMQDSRVDTMNPFDRYQRLRKALMILDDRQLERWKELVGPINRPVLKDIATPDLE